MATIARQRGLNPGDLDRALTNERDNHPGAHTVVDLIIGNEVDRTDNKGALDPQLILNYSEYGQQQIASNGNYPKYLANVRVTSFSGTVLNPDKEDRDK